MILAPNLIYLDAFLLKKKKQTNSALLCLLQRKRICAACVL
jgi:hypothetical protein